MRPKLLAVVAVLAAAPALALAQPYYRDARPRYVPPHAAQVYASPRHYAAQCYAWCPEDRNPCDPANFKIADGRCKPAGTTGFDR